MEALEETLALAKRGDISAFNALFQLHRDALRSYLYRLLTNKEDVEDFYHNTFIKAFEKIDGFQGDVSQLKSWIFTIATRLSINHLNQKKRWEVNAQDTCRDSLVNNPEEQKSFVKKVVDRPHNHYDVKEHIDFCFTCINKTLTIEKQVALLLKNVYDFKVREVAEIMATSIGRVKHLLIDSRKEMTEIFEHRCALINRNGACHQCSELQGLFNPKADFHREAIRLKMVKDAEEKDKNALYELREALVKQIDPLESKGTNLHDLLMQHLKNVNQLN